MLMERGEKDEMTAITGGRLGASVARDIEKEEVSMGQEMLIK